MLRNIVVYLLIYFYMDNVTSTIEPSYKLIQNLLHEKIERIFSSNDNEINNKQFRTPVGKFFKYDLVNQLQDIYEVVETGKSELPKWLHFDYKKKRLLGVPTKQDIASGLKIEFHVKNNDVLNGATQPDHYITIDVYQPIKDPLKCMNSDAVSIASIIFNSDISELDGLARTKLIKSLARTFDKSKKDFFFEAGNKMDSTDSMYSSNIRIAGPGDKVVGDSPGFTISFIIKCSSDIAGSTEVADLKSLSQQGDFRALSSVSSVLGWFVSTSKTNRVKRAVGVGGTPGVKPTAVQGTPVLVPSSTISPSKSTAIAMSSTVVATTETPTTKEITTEKTTTEKTTEKPTTTESSTTEKSTTEKTTEPPKTTKEITTEEIITIKPVNRPPRLVGKIDMIEIHENQFLERRVPRDLFFDPDGDQLDLELRYIQTFVDGERETKVQEGNWIVYEKNARLFLSPSAKHIGAHRFSLVATDPSGESVKALFELRVQRDQPYKFVFNITFDMDYDQLMNDIEAKHELLKTLANALDLQSYEELRGVRVLPGSVVVQFSTLELRDSDCNDPLIEAYKSKLESSEFQEKFAPIKVISVGAAERKECISGEPIASEGTLQHILIPIIIVVIVLIIILIVLCCVCRRKRKYNKAPINEDDKLYLNHKKPIIFQEEYDEKESFFSLTPTTLPHEKPPVTNNYNDTSEGPGSSTTVSTESDEKVLLTQGSPKESRQPFNSPPPYGA